MQCSLLSKNDDDSDDSDSHDDEDNEDDEDTVDDGNDDHLWIRGTWIPPKNKKKSRIPEVPSIFVKSK